MPRAYVSIGSNVDRERHIREAAARLVQDFDEVVFSPVYETAAVGFDGDPFYNLVAGITTTLLPDELNAHLHAIEADMGRDQAAPSFSARGIDLDLLLYDDLVLMSATVSVPRRDIETYAFVLCPLAALAPDLTHPARRVTLAEMAAARREECAALTRVELPGLGAPASAHAAHGAGR